PNTRASAEFRLIHAVAHDELQVHAGGGVAGDGAGDEIGAGAVGDEGEVVDVADADAGFGILRLGAGEDGAAGNEWDGAARGDDARRVRGGVGVAESHLDAPAEWDDDDAGATGASVERHAGGVDAEPGGVAGCVVGEEGAGARRRGGDGILLRRVGLRWRDEALAWRDRVAR